MGYFLKEVRGDFARDAATHGSMKPNAAYQAGDILFDWTPFDLPHAAELVSVSIIGKGTEGADQSQPKINFYFAKSIDGVAPSKLGNTNSAVNTPTIAAGEGWFNHVIAKHEFEEATLDGTLDTDLIYLTAISSSTHIAPNIVLQAEGKGYNNVYLAATVADGTPDYGTGVLLNQGSDQAATTTRTTLTVDGVSALLVFAPGDVIVAEDGAAIGTILEVVSATSIIVDKCEAAIEDDDEICHVSPIRVFLGFKW
tara:strand:+ start:185 stop:946 length:762 start_codon:yes stop_codon:yes gene_type:complete